MGTKLLLTAVSWPTLWIVPYTEGTVLLLESKWLPLSPHPPLPPPSPARPPPIDSIHDIIGTEKFIQKTSSIQELVQIAIYIVYLSGVTILYHIRRTGHSIFQIHISQNTKCTDKTGFPDLVTINSLELSVHSYRWELCILNFKI